MLLDKVCKLARYLMIALLAAQLSSLAAGADITYNVNINITSSNPTGNPLQSDSVIGTITTDGTIGTILAHNIKSWDLKLVDLLNSANNVELTPANSEVVEDGDGAGDQIGGGGLTATATGLFYDFSNPSAEFGFQTSANLYSGYNYFCLSDGLYACAAGESIAPNYISTDGVIATGTAGPVGKQPLNTAAVTITGVTNGASFKPGFASATWVSIFGTNLAQTSRQWQASDFAGTALPVSLSGVSVTINGNPAYVEYISPTQINVLAPDDATVGSVNVQVTAPQGASNVFAAQRQQLAPAFFTMGGGYVAALHADYSYVGKQGLIPEVTTTPVKPGETILLYATGFGPTSPPLPCADLVTTPAELANIAQVTIGEQQAKVSWAGLVGAGLYQLNVVVPNLPSGDSPIGATIGGAESFTGVLVTVQ